MCSDCRVVETELIADRIETAGLQVIRVHPETEVREIAV